MSARPKTAKDTVRAYLEAWKTEDWDALQGLVQTSYRGVFRPVPGHHWRPEQDLLHYTVISDERLSAVMRDVTVGLRFVTDVGGCPLSPYRFRVIRERKRDGAPSRWGSWGVNPDSMRRL